MYTTITVLSYILVLSIVFCGGFVTCRILGSLQKSKDYSGTMRVIREDDGVLYSLEIDDDPSKLQYMSEVVFKVETSDES